jgi:hypothetical protein
MYILAIMLAALGIPLAALIVMLYLERRAGHDH